jgi:hypothetical protein
MSSYTSLSRGLGKALQKNKKWKIIQTKKRLMPIAFSIVVFYAASRFTYIVLEKYQAHII